MAYGIRLYNKYGKLNIDGESRAIRLHDEGITSVPARIVTGTTCDAGSITVDIAPIRYIPMVDVVDVDPIFPVYIRDTGIYATLVDALDASNQIYRIILYNSSDSIRLVKWRVWAYL